MRARERGPQGPLRPLRAALRLRPPAGARAAQQPAAGAPARLGGGTPSEGHRAATPARRAGPEGRTAPAPHNVGAGPPRSTCAATGAGEEQRKARAAAPQGLGLALRRGAPAQRLAANWTGPGLPGLGRHITPARPRRGLDGAGGGQPPPRVGRGAARRPLGAGGTAQRAGREPPPPPQAVAPWVGSRGAGHPGAMQRGQRRWPLSECGHGQRSGRAAGVGRAETPAPAPGGRSARCDPRPHRGRIADRCQPGADREGQGSPPPPLGKVQYIGQ